MYQLVSAIVKPLDSAGRWRSMGIEEVPLNELFNNFRRVIATLSNTVLPGNVSFDIESMRAQLGGLTKTFGQWLTENGDATLATSTRLPTINTRYANYSDAVRAGYKITPTHPTISPTSPLPIEDKTHLLLTKVGADYALVYNNALINVNGFYHQTDYSTDGVFVVDGMKSCLKANRNEIGLLSFLQLGTLAFIPLTDDMIYTQQPTQQLRYNCYLDAKTDLSNKTVMLVLGGYLHTLDQRTFFRISPSAFGVDFGQVPLVDRFYESREVLDLSSLNLETTAANDTQVAISDLLSDAVLRRYLQLPQTFLVVLDNEEVFTDTIDVKPSPFPGTYTSAVTPIYPLMLGHGRHENFWPRLEYDRYSINTHTKSAWTGSKNYETVKTRALNSVSAAELASLGFRNTQAHFQLIGTDIYVP